LPEHVDQCPSRTPLTPVEKNGFPVGSTNHQRPVRLCSTRKNPVASNVSPGESDELPHATARTKLAKIIR